jgi:hypothetical protein
LDVHSHEAPAEARDHWDPRRHPRYKIEVDLSVSRRNANPVRGYSVDLSESGISAILREDVPLNEIVMLKFPLPGGEVEIHAHVQQRNAFPYGF